MLEQIYYNGPILTMEDALYAEALYVKEGKIEKVGTYEEIIKLKHNVTELIDLKGHTLMPAFIDPHSHITAFANTLILVDLSSVTSFKALKEKLIAFKNSKPLTPGEWIIGFGYDHNVLTEKEHPTKLLLDEVSSQHPILISHASGHMGVVNTPALVALGITATTPNPEGGHIGRTEGSQEPNGYLEENAFLHNSSKIPQPSMSTIIQAMDEAQNIYLSYGITTAQDGMVNAQDWQLGKYLADQNKLKIDVVGYVDLKNSPLIIKQNPTYVGQYVNHYKLGGYKIFLDGSPQGKTAWLTKPYENAEGGYRGYPIYTEAEVESLVKAALDENLQLLTHCNGDAAADQLLTAFENVLKDGHYEDIRPVMIHAQTVRYDQIDRMKAIHMIPSYFVAHTYYWGDIHIQNLGMERASKISPVHTTLLKDVPYTFHQDTPVVLPHMLHTVWCAINRMTQSGVILGEEEKLSPLDALKAITINAAYQYFEEDTKGSLKAGKVADLVILDQNPLTVDPMMIKDIQVLETIKGGKTLYTRA